jgi:hypothetical protein
MIGEKQARGADHYMMICAAINVQQVTTLLGTTKTHKRGSLAA